MTPDEMKARTKAFALAMIGIAERLPMTALGRTICEQMIRCGCSVASNYRSACRAKSTKDFIAKVGIVEEETDGCMFWLEIVAQKKLITRELIDTAYKEANEILSIAVASINTARKRST